MRCCLIENISYLGVALIVFLLLPASEAWKGLSMSEAKTKHAYPCLGPQIEGTLAVSGISEDWPSRKWISEARHDFLSSIQRLDVRSCSYPELKMHLDHDIKPKRQQYHHHLKSTWDTLQKLQYFVSAALADSVPQALPDMHHAEVCSEAYHSFPLPLPCDPSPDKPRCQIIITIHTRRITS